MKRRRRVSTLKVLFLMAAISAFLMASPGDGLEEVALVKAGTLKKNPRDKHAITRQGGGPHGASRPATADLTSTGRRPPLVCRTAPCDTQRLSGPLGVGCLFLHTTCLFQK